MPERTSEAREDVRAEMAQNEPRASEARSEAKPNEEGRPDSLRAGTVASGARSEAKPNEEGRPDSLRAGTVRSVLRDAWTIAQKDLRLEFRSKEILLTMGFFGFLSVLVLAFAFRRGDAPIAAVASGSLWVAVAFSGTMGLGRAFDRERENECIRALLLTPVPRQAIFLGKALGIIVFMAIVELIVLPGVVLFFNLPVDLERVGRTLLILFLGTIGYALVGTLLAASLIRAQSRDVLLVVVLFPLIVPVIIAGAMGTNAIYETTIAYEQLATWMRVLFFFDVVFLVASMWIFEALILD